MARSSDEMEETLARSHDFCRCELGPEGCGSLRHLDHCVMAESQMESSDSCMIIYRKIDYYTNHAVKYGFRVLCPF